MITSSEVGEIFFDMCREFGVQTILLSNMPTGEIKDERIVIIVNGEQPSTYWLNRTVKVNWCIPDVEGETSVKIKEIEQKLSDKFKRGVGEYGENFYRFHLDSNETFSDEDMRCHFANITIMFQTLNIKQNGWKKSKCRRY